MAKDLSVIIAARNEEWLVRTVQGVLDNKRADTEVIVVLDGAWPIGDGLPDHKDVKVIFHSTSIGQRAAINEAIKLSQAKYIMKLDAHCIVDEGFDVKLMADCEPNWTVIPAMYNLHAFDWVCDKCGNRWYQGPTPTRCFSDDQGKTPNESCTSTEFHRDITWEIRKKRRSEFMRFDKDLHFQYWPELGKRPESKGDIADTMSFVGASFFMERDWYWKMGGSEEEWGSWGQQGTELSCKTWLLGGRVVVNKKTWFSHLFRTQGGDFGFPYPQSGRQVERAREMSREFFLHNKFKGIHPLSWLLEKFWPIPGWTDEDLERQKINELPTQGIIYYTDNQLNLKIAHAAQKMLLKTEIPIVSASLKPMDFGKNIRLRLSRGYLTMFKQILAALEASTADIVFFCEHDVLYHQSHFFFTPPDRTKWYYNENVWKVNAETGHAIHYKCKQVSGICVYRDVAIEHYRKRIEIVTQKTEDLKDGKMTKKEFNYFIRRMGYEPGTHNRDERVDQSSSGVWESDFPNVDIRHGNNLSATRWSISEFRNQDKVKDWTESNSIPGWGITEGRFDQFIKELA